MNILITGGNRGIGAALTRRYRDDGHDVFTTSRDGSGDFSVDVRSPDQISTLSKAFDSRPLNVLVCNAGVYLDKTERLDDGYAAVLWAESFAVNVTGVFLTIQALLPALREAKGKIAILSSQMASHTRAPGGSYAYRASKAAVLNLGRNLSRDLAADGVAVGVYHPGWVQTDMGGAGAELTIESAVDGLKDRFDALTLANTGCFETWDGRVHAY